MKMLLVGKVCWQRGAEDTRLWAAGVLDLLLLFVFAPALLLAGYLIEGVLLRFTKGKAGDTVFMRGIIAGVVGLYLGYFAGRAG